MDIELPLDEFSLDEHHEDSEARWLTGRPRTKVRIEQNMWGKDGKLWINDKYVWFLQKITLTIPVDGVTTLELEKLIDRVDVDLTDPRIITKERCPHCGHVKTIVQESEQADGQQPVDDVSKGGSI